MAASLPGMRTAVVAVVFAGCVLAGCGEEMQEAASKPAANTQPEQKPAAAKKKKAKRTFVKVMKTRYGKILVDGKGRALYLFDKEKSRKSECYGACAKAWPVFHARGKPKAGKGIQQKLLGTSKRKDGRSMVTYNGHPLYYYVTDKAPGEVTCQNVDEFGGLWLVVAPSGNAIRSAR